MLKYLAMSASEAAGSRPTRTKKGGKEMRIIATKEEREKREKKMMKVK